jgi:hypothetical protein
MAHRQNGIGVRPWPTRYECTDGLCRDLEHFKIREWPDHGRPKPRNRPSYQKQQWHAERGNVARMLGRKLLPELQAALGVGPLADYCGGGGL